MSFIAAIGHGLSTTIGVLIIFRLLLGVSMGFSLALTMTMVSDSLPNEKMGSGLGIFSLGQALATAIGPYVGLEIINSIGYRNTFFFAAALNLISIVLIFVVKMDTNEKVKPFKINLNNMIAVECWKPAIILCLFSMSYSTFSSYLALYADGKSIQNIGLFFSTYAIMLLLSRPLSGKLTDKYGSLRVVIPCCFLFSIAFCFISFGNNIIMMLIAAIISAFAYGGVSPAMQAMCITLVSKEQRAAASSTSYLGMDIGHFIGPVLAGVIIDAVSGIRGYEVMFLACIFPIAIALAFAFSSLKSVNIKQSLVD